MYNGGMTLTIDNLPLPMLDALRRKACEEGRTLEEVAMEALARGLGVGGAPGGKKRDLSGVAGTMTEEDARAIEEVVRWMDEGDLSTRG